jgi:peptidoglycan/xylan/chitin deacetylase (PgdA/CDA1 family)
MINHKSIKNLEKIILNLIDFFKFLQNKNNLRSLVFHNIEKNDYKIFYDYLLSLKKEWTFITPNQLENHLKNKKKIKGKKLLITFDDGFKSNFNIEKEILNKLKIKCIFFVPTEFIKLRSLKKSKMFIGKNILDNYISKKNNHRNMTSSNLKSLLDKGHTIGSHTKTHANLGSIIDNDNLKDEIINSAKYLEKILNTKIKHFAFTYGNYDSMSYQSLKLALPQYDFIYSCLRGNNYKVGKNEIIKRDAIYLNKGSNLSTIFLSGFFDFKYFFHTFIINKLIKKINK